MPDPLCRVSGMAVIRNRGDEVDDRADRLVPPTELKRLRLALGRSVRQLRAVSGVSQETLGTDASLHRNYVGAIERGEINPTLRVLCKLAYGLGVPASDLLAMAERLAAEWSRNPSLGGKP